MGIMTRITQPGVLLIALGLLALSLKPAGSASPRVRLPFDATFAGVSDDSLVWEAQFPDENGGRARLLLRQVEGPPAAANPIWHVQAHWTVAADSPPRSFAAELEGIVDWKARTARLSGVVTAGWMKGAWVEQTGQFVNGDISGALEVSPGWE